MDLIRMLCQRICRNSDDPLETHNEATPLFTLRGQTYSAKVVHIENLTEAEVVMCCCIHDTRLPLGYHSYVRRFQIRLEGVSIPHASTRITLANLLPLDKRVILVAGEFDTDGRLLATIYSNENMYRIGDSSINELLMLENNMDAVLAETIDCDGL
jgi:hypothetical protein